MKRSFCLCVLAAGCLLAIGPLGQAAKEPAKKKAKASFFNGPVGLQLYSLRNEFAKDVPGTLATVRGFGIRLAELAGTYDLPPDKFRARLADYDVKPISAHFPYERFRDDIDGVVKEARTLGIKYAGCAWIPHDGPFDLNKCREAIGIFNRAGAVLASHGIKFFYHQHGYEFQKYGQGTLLDLMMTETNPQTVSFEMDIFWVQFPGQDPVLWLEKYGKRWELMHLKDMKNGLKTGDLSGHTDVTNDVTIGTGQMDIPAILKAAQKIGVKYYFIEDESPSSVQQIPQSQLYLRKLNL